MRDIPASVMLFAAGFGARMRPLTDHRPKPLIEVAGRPLAQHAMEQARGLDYVRFVANAHYLADQIEGYFVPLGVTVNREEPEILETGGGLRNALPLLGDGAVFTMNTDAVWRGPAALHLLAQAWNPEEMDALLLCVPPERARGHRGAGDFIVTDDSVARGPGLIYTGAQIIKTQDLSEIPETSFSMNTVWDLMMARRRLKIAVYPGLWCDVGRPDSIPLAEAMLGEQVG